VVTVSTADGAQAGYCVEHKLRDKHGLLSIEWKLFTE
jgi:hypothetical protein